MNGSTLLIDKILIKFKIRSSIISHLVVICTGTLLISLLAQIKIPLSFTPVPITGQTLGIIIIGSSFGPLRGTVSSLLYLILGTIGLPVFAGGTSGFSVVFGPTGGYLFGFIVASYIMGKFSQMKYNEMVIEALPIFFIGHMVIFFFGVSWLAVQMGLKKAILSGLIPFIPGLLIKTLIASLLYPGVLKLLKDPDSE